MKLEDPVGLHELFKSYLSVDLLRCFDFVVKVIRRKSNSFDLLFFNFQLRV